jgi:hypothetical protein
VGSLHVGTLDALTGADSPENEGGRAHVERGEVSFSCHRRPLDSRLVAERNKVMNLDRFDLA